MYQNHVLYVNVTRCYFSRLGCCFNVSTEWRGGGNEGVETNRVTPAKRVFRVDQGRSKCHITWLSLFGTSLILIAFPHTCFNVGFFFLIKMSTTTPSLPPIHLLDVFLLPSWEGWPYNATVAHAHTNTCSYTQGRTHAHTYTNTSTRTCIQTHTYNKRKHVHIYTRTHGAHSACPWLA